jgi:hypothetical protein
MRGDSAGGISTQEVGAADGVEGAFPIVAEAVGVAAVFGAVGSVVFMVVDLAVFTVEEGFADRTKSAIWEHEE